MNARLCPALAAGLLGLTIAYAGQDPKQIKPLTEPGQYERDGKRHERGLYPGGKNEMPQAHRQAGERLAKTITPLAAGKPAPEKGEIVAVAIGHSNPRAYFNAMQPFLKDKASKGEVNPRFVLVNACAGGKLCQDWAAECKQSGQLKVPRPADVQVLFVLVTYHRANRQATQSKNPDVLSTPFEKKMLRMKEELKLILQTAAKTCPNLKLAYLGSDTWRGNAMLEPEAYEEGFAVKWLIEDQLRGDAELAFEGAQRKIPWLAWGGYIWEADAPRDRFVADGVHPSDKGNAFVIDRWYGTLAKDSTTRPWLLQK
jgi:hypothetical protein